MVARDPAVRSQVARMGALARIAQGKTTSRAGHEAFMARFEREVDPDGVLDPAERAKRADAAKRLYFSRLRRRQGRG